MPSLTDALLSFTPDSDPADLNARLIALARYSPAVFVSLCIANEEDPDTPIKVSSFQAEAHQLQEVHDFLLFEWPRGHGKTVQNVIGRRIWEMGHRPWRRAAIVCANENDAKARIAVIGQYIKESALVRAIFPWLMPDKVSGWSALHLNIIRWSPRAVALFKAGSLSISETRNRGDFRIYSKDPSLAARSVTGAGTGSRVDDLILDDPVDFTNCIKNPALRSIVASAIVNNWLNTLAKRGAKVRWFGTPWADDDALALTKLGAVLVGSEADKKAPKKQWRLHRVPVLSNADGTPKSIWPEYVTDADLLDTRAKIGDTAFARAYYLKSVSDTDRLFSEAALGKIAPVSSESVAGLPTFGGIDLATSKKDTADFRVIATCALTKTGQRVILNSRRGKWGSVETADVVIEEWQKYQWRVGKLENNAAQDAMLEWIQIRCKAQIEAGKLAKQVFIYLQPHTTTAVNKWDIFGGLPALAAEMEAGKWRVVLPDEHTGDALCGCWWCDMLGELRGFRQNGTSVAPHDDIVMALWFAREAVVSGSGLGLDMHGKDSRVVKGPEKLSIRQRSSGF